MNHAMLRKVFADLRVYRLQTALIFLVLVAASATLTLALTISRAADQPWERAFEEANGAHLTLHAFRMNPDDRIADLSEAAALPNVVATAGPYAGVTTSALIHDGEKHALLVQEAPEALPSVNRPLITDGRWSSAPGEVVLDRALARDLEIEIGDTVTLLGAGGLLEQRVAGLAVIPWRGPEHSGQPLAYVATGTLRQLEPNERSWLMIYAVRLSDPSLTQMTTMNMMRQFQGTAVSFQAWHEVRDDVVFWNELNGIFLGMFSVFALVAVGLIVANLISARVLSQYRDIGLLKAAGFTPWQVTGAFLIQHLLVALIASLVGLVAGVAIAPLFLRRLAEAMHTTAVPTLDPFTALAVPLGVLLVVAVFTIVPAWRGGRVSTLGAITSSALVSRRGPSRLAGIARSLRLAPVVTLGLKDSFARPWRSFMTVVALVLTVVTIIFTLGVDAVFERVFGNPAVQGEPYNIVVNPGRLSRESTAAILDAESGIASWHTRSTVRAVVNSGSTPAPSQLPGLGAPGFSLRIVEGNVSDAGYIVSEGRMFERPGEVVVAWGILDRFGLRIGDTLMVTVQGQPTQLTITGRYLDDDNDGEVAMTSAATVGGVLEDQPVSFLVNLRSGVQEQAVAASLLAASGYQLDLWTRADEAQGDAGADSMPVVLAGLSGVLLAIGLVNLFSTTVLSVRERMRDVGVFRAVGLTPAQVMTSIMTSIGFLALLATVIGIPLGLWTYQITFRVLASGVLKAPPEWYAAPPWWQVALVIPGAILVAILASVVPARHAARIAVATVLRYE